MFCIGNLLFQIFALEGFVKACPVGLTDSHKFLHHTQSFLHGAVPRSHREPCFIHIWLISFNLTRIWVNRRVSADRGTSSSSLPFAQTGTAVALTYAAVPWRFSQGRDLTHRCMSQTGLSRFDSGVSGSPARKSSAVIAGVLQWHELF